MTLLSGWPSQVWYLFNVWSLRVRRHPRPYRPSALAYPPSRSKRPYPQPTRLPMFRRSLASSSSSSSTRSLSSLVVRPMATLTLSPRALPSGSTLLRTALYQGSLRCKTSYEDPKGGHVISSKDLRHDWADKGPVSFDEMKEISKRAGASTVSPSLELTHPSRVQPTLITASNLTLPF
jgi:hypothetical protein